jgi:RHS repeat-associated protein
VPWPFGWTAYRQKVFQAAAWHGTVLEQKRDGSGLLFKRNRYVDPATGKFTQEDPIGLAGGMNLYGFAGGDPVDYSDPFGLCPPADQNPYDCPGKMGAFVMLGQMVPQINREVALFLPKQAATAASGLALESVIGKALGWVTGRFAGSVIASGNEDVITLYHQGNLAGGRVSATRSLSTSTSPDLAHYAPDEALQTFKVPLRVFQAWDKAHYVTRWADTYNGIVTQEIRIEAGPSGELNKYLVRP